MGEKTIGARCTLCLKELSLVGDSAVMRLLLAGAKRDHAKECKGELVPVEK